MKLPLLLLAAAALAAPAYAGFSRGGAAYTKWAETSLLAAPSPLAHAVARVGFAQKLKIEEVRGIWLRVHDGRNTGWVFAGNVADQKPAENRGLDGLPISASETSATAAARPLAPAANNYAQRRGLGQARVDVDWLVHFDAAISAAEITAYMRANKKGEYQ